MKCLSVVIILFLHGVVIAQTAPAKKEIRVTFGNMTGSKMLEDKEHGIKMEKHNILVNPRFATNRPDIEIIEFTCSILPVDGDVVGPFKIKGSALPSNVVDRLTATPAGKIYLESIQVKIEGTRRTLNPMTIVFDN